MVSQGRVWLITGCSAGGFGRAVAEEALLRGDRVIGTLRRREQFPAFEALAPGRCHALELDVREAGSIDTVVSQAIARYGRIDVLLNNAGYGLFGAIEETSLAEVREIFETNFFGALQVLQALLPQLRAQGGGHILNMSSAAGVTSIAGLGIYSASKHALEAVSEALAEELDPLGIRVTLIEPGAFNTGFPKGGLRQASGHIEAYAATTGYGVAGMQHYYEAGGGNPVRLAHAIMTILEEPKPPLRLVLGADALAGVRRKLELLKRDFDAWEPLAMSTGRSDVTQQAGISSMPL